MLIVRLRSLGDIVLTIPALEALHAWRPDLRLTVAIEPAFVPILENHPAVREIFLVRGFLSAASNLAFCRFAIVYNQHGGPTSALLTAATLAPVRVAWERSQFPFLANVRVPGPEAFFGDRGAHTAEHRLTQFYWTGLPRGPVPPARIHLGDPAKQLASALLAAHHLERGRPYAVIQPGAAFATRRWPLERFVGLAEWLAEEAGLAPIVVLGPGEAAEREEAKRIFRAPAVVMDGLNLHELMGVIAEARLFVGHDTGPTHIAAGLGRPVVEIFGSSNPVYWRPWATPSRVVLNEFPCRPCRGDRCYEFSEPRCILSVTQDQVRTACRELLAETATPKS